MVDVRDIDTVFDNRFTRQFGRPHERAVTKMTDRLPDTHIDVIRQSPFLVMATSDAAGRCDASPKGGLPGFVKVLDDSRLLIPDVAGNKLFQSYLNIAENPHIGLVFFMPGVRGTLRVNGRATIVSKEELDRLGVRLEVQNPDDNAKLLQGIMVEVEEAYRHCPRALAFSDLWDEQRIRENRDRTRRA